MPLLRPERLLIEMPLTDLQRGDTVVKQKAVFQKLEHGQDADGFGTVYVTVRVNLYAKEGDGYGTLLTGNGFQSYPATLTADNSTLVDAATGNILAIRHAETEPEWVEKIESFEQPTMLQGDFFLYLRENQPIKIGDMIRQHIQNADAMGRFA